MPIHLPFPITALDQEEFGKIAYKVMEAVFRIHQELGRFFDESVYQTAIATQMANAQMEFPVEVRHDGFCKTFFLDLVINQCAIFELKTADALHPIHRAQLLNYLLLTGCRHGKLVNLRPERVEHEFVNSTLEHHDRVCFEVDSREWQELGPADRPFRPWFEAALRDWGAGLDRQLYEESAIHFFGGPEAVKGQVEVQLAEHRLAQQPVRLAFPRVALEVTTLDPLDLRHFNEHLSRFLRHSSLNAVCWINVHRKRVSFQTLRR